MTKTKTKHKVLPLEILIVGYKGKYLGVDIDGNCTISKGRPTMQVSGVFFYAQGGFRMQKLTDELAENVLPTELYESIDGRWTLIECAGQLIDRP